MAINRIIIVFLICLYTNVFSQDALQLQNKRSVYLNNVEYTLSFKTNVDSLSNKVLLSNDNKNIAIKLSQSENEIQKYSSQQITFDESGTWELQVDGTITDTFWVVPGWASLLPPILAILLALLTRQVLVALLTLSLILLVVTQVTRRMTGSPGTPRLCR